MGKAFTFQLAALAGLAVCASGQTSRPANDKVGIINHALASDDPAQLDLASKEIGLLLDSRQIPSVAVRSWMPGLMAKNRYEDVTHLGLRLANLVPDARTIDAMMQLRVRAFLALGQAKKALEAAKIEFNVCPMENSQRALATLADCMGKATPDDPGIGRRFMLTVTQGDQPAAANASQPGELRSAQFYLKTITVDAAAFATELERLKGKKTTLGDEINYGNLLLASDRTEEAEAVLQELYNSRTVAREKAQAAEALARAYRARDGNLWRANQLMAAQPPAPPPQPRTTRPAPKAEPDIP